jgi:hypothetical protein
MGDTIVPLIFMSDATHLTNFAGDHKAWPVYMTIGNLSPAVRMRPATQSVLLVGLLPVPLKLRDVPARQLAWQRERNRTVTQGVLRRILEPLSRPEGGVFTALCADGHHRQCYATVSAWVADYPEHCDLHNLLHGSCIWCECPADQMGDYRPPNGHHPTRDHHRYAAWNATHDVASLTSHRVHAGDVALRYLPGCTVSDLPKPDLLHTMHIGMLKHLLEWLQAFLKDHGRFDRFNNLWLSVPSYLGMAAPRLAYGEVSRWTGKEVKRMSTFVLAVLRNALRAPTPAERGIFDRAILCSRALLEFFFYASYPSHDQATLDLMENALRRFHATKDVFLRYRAGKRVAAGATERRADLIQQRDADLARQRLDGLSSTALQAERRSWNDFIDAEVVETVEDGAHWNFPKIHLMMHFCEQVRRFGALGQWSTEIGESSHRRQIKDGYNAGNRTGDIYLQIINHYLRLDAFTVRRLNLDAWRAKHRPPDAAPTAAATAAAASSAAAPVAATTAATASSAAAPVAAAPSPPPPPRLRFVSPQLTSGAGKVRTVGGGVRKHVVLRSPCCATPRHACLSPRAPRCTVRRAAPRLPRHYLPRRRCIHRRYARFFGRAARPLHWRSSVALHLPAAGLGVGAPREDATSGVCSSTVQGAAGPSPVPLAALIHVAGSL